MCRERELSADLLAALKSLMNKDGSSAELPAYDTRCVLAVEAIAKAEGREARDAE